MQKKVILITGVSSGLGRAIANALIADGHTVIGTSRQPKNVNQSETWMQSERFDLLSLDVTKPDSIDQCIKILRHKYGTLDVLINNAGMGIAGPIETATESQIRVQWETNFLGTVRLCQKLLSWMRTRGYGRIINISSIGGIIGLPFQGFYSASKFAVEGFSEALQQEVQDFGIDVIVVEPGDFRTEFTDHRQSAQVPADHPYAASFQAAQTTFESDERSGWNADRLGKKMVKIVKTTHPKFRYRVGAFSQKLAVWIKPILPDRWFLKIIRAHYF